MSLQLIGWPCKAFSHLCSFPPNLLPFLNPQIRCINQKAVGPAVPRTSSPTCNRYWIPHFAFRQTQQAQGAGTESAAGFGAERHNSGRCTWMRCRSVSCSCSLVMQVLLATAGSGAGRGRSRLPELAAGSALAAARRPLSAPLGGVGVGWLNTMGDISRVGVTEAGMRWGDMTCPDKNTTVRGSHLLHSAGVEEWELQGDWQQAQTAVRSTQLQLNTTSRVCFQIKGASIPSQSAHTDWNRINPIGKCSYDTKILLQEADYY